MKGRQKERISEQNPLLICKTTTCIIIIVKKINSKRRYATKANLSGSIFINNINSNIPAPNINAI
ncbi:hypothetical protein MKQ70_00015 [Chitinophaga sedimenti]|uniref:hypothetical protein n=1 Tax=Chitinophaga sedimenti TaxID=2033606 RepID=UPI002004D9B9|nr:hypothetical protein [Chitinophaga sedimenti]MCK7553472.1 hypothetical protein [Chitinophaga sedimenti]